MLSSKIRRRLRFFEALVSREFATGFRCFGLAIYVGLVVYVLAGDPRSLAGDVAGAGRNCAAIALQYFYQNKCARENMFVLLSRAQRITFTASSLYSRPPRWSNR